MREFFKYFNFSRAEQNGLFVLFILILLLFSFPYILNIFNPTDFDAYKIQAFEQKDSDTITFEKTKKQGFTSDRSQAPAHHLEPISPTFRFDPNTLDDAGWLGLGFTEKQIKVINNYRNKGGRFYKKEDLSKIYSISTIQYKRLESFIEIESSDPSDNKQEGGLPNQNTKFQNNKFVQTIVDINTGDTTAFIKLKGIGSSYARRIVKYRESLGGYIRVEQIKEIYGLPPETFESILPYLKISANPPISKLQINEIDSKSLAKHPYISDKQAIAIVNYRLQHGNYRNLDDLSKVALVDDDLLRKLAAYLTF
ncbi:helix-hairpin-helix domain-containing protein [Sphingobacterium sp. SRCM116780]|uniref:helix-hairpin-helix domain-containing protein n=1 Tax=Sphingobacterium sp. SRCM116780 TaxID=2907623 RepID=UPI001F1CC54B|nr:helix-hairpin-helix domain-containing protein [Sphingobacterium sp. SRCM116780]UIR57147.1 helix-hairpin-helix domain-containing protein [Sphingobacterium sp. SRCM116780]